MSIRGRADDAFDREFPDGIFPPTRAFDFKRGYVIAVRDEILLEVDREIARGATIKSTTQELLARPCWSCGAHSREWFAANREAAVPYPVEHIPTDAEAAECVARLGIDVPKWAAEVRAKVAAALLEQAPQAEATPPEHTKGAAMRRDKIATMLDAKFHEREPALLHELANSLASFIAAIDSSSADVSAYLEQRLAPLVPLMRTDERVRSAIDRIGKDGRQLIRKPAGEATPPEPHVHRDDPHVCVERAAPLAVAAIERELLAIRDAIPAPESKP